MSGWKQHRHAQVIVERCQARDVYVQAHGNGTGVNQSEALKKSEQLAHDGTGEAHSERAVAVAQAAVWPIAPRARRSAHALKLHTAPPGHKLGSSTWLRRPIYVGHAAIDEPFVVAKMACVLRESRELCFRPPAHPSTSLRRGRRETNRACDS